MKLCNAGAVTEERSNICTNWYQLSENKKIPATIDSGNFQSRAFNLMSGWLKINTKTNDELVIILFRDKAICIWLWVIDAIPNKRKVEIEDAG